MCLLYVFLGCVDLPSKHKLYLIMPALREKTIDILKVSYQEKYVSNLDIFKPLALFLEGAKTQSFPSLNTLEEKTALVDGHLHQIAASMPTALPLLDFDDMAALMKITPKVGPAYVDHLRERIGIVPDVLVPLLFTEDEIFELASTPSFPPGKLLLRLGLVHEKVPIMAGLACRNQAPLLEKAQKSANVEFDDVLDYLQAKPVSVSRDRGLILLRPYSKAMRNCWKASITNGASLTPEEELTSTLNVLSVFSAFKSDIPPPMIKVLGSSIRTILEHKPKNFELLLERARALNQFDLFQTLTEAGCSPNFTSLGQDPLVLMRSPKHVPFAYPLLYHTVKHKDLRWLNTAVESGLQDTAPPELPLWKYGIRCAALQRGTKEFTNTFLKEVHKVSPFPDLEEVGIFLHDQDSFVSKDPAWRELLRGCIAQQVSYKRLAADAKEAKMALVEIDLM